MSDYGDHGQRLGDFRATLAIEANDENIVRQHVLHGSAFAIEDGQTFALKQFLASRLGADANSDIYIVGSAKMGFSIAPKKRYIPFGDHSDVDVAIVSHSLYQRVWHEVHAYSESGADWPRRERFEQYLAWGWIRPDMLPRSPAFEFSNHWWESFRIAQAERIAGPFKVAGALYHDLSFLIRYQQQSVSLCRVETE